MPVHSHVAPPRPRLGAPRARFAAAAGFILAICAAAGASQAQSLTTPFSQSNVPLASLASQVQYTVDMSSLPARPRLIVEAIPDAAHADMELELQISNCTLDNPVAPGSSFFCPSPVSTPNGGLQTVSFDAFFCETATTIPAYPGETCRVTVRALDFGAAGAPATFDVAIRGDTIVPTSTTSADVTTSIQTVSIAPTKDTTLYQVNTGSSNGQGESFWTRVAAGTALNSLLAFNVQANVPAGATILDAWLDLQVLSTSGATPAFDLYVVPRNGSVAWLEGSANATSADESTPPTPISNAASWSHRQWMSFFPSGQWSTPGGDRQLLALQSASVNQTGLLRLASASLLSHVQTIHTNTTTYDGLLLLPTSGAVRFASDEYTINTALRPRLYVQYVAPATPVDDNIPTTTAQYFNEGQDFRWIYDLDADNVFITDITGRCEWSPPGGFLINMPYTYQYQGSPTYHGLDCCTWQIGSSTGVTGTGQALFFINVDSSLPANQPPDSDLDGIKNLCDNCPTVPNGPLFGTCTSGPLTGSTCRSNQQCNNFPCSLSQDDTNRDGDGDACVPEPGLGAMLGTGLAAIAAIGRSRRARRA